ncbi:DUF3352 domain-containing protein [Leptothoe sp. PORK10 BA2]|uniref:DUF3352 domain-containing protein n=1 Tax=Leptothoe sp. PORK10 BA2 TaxID=3110254 RepID=UPI002B1F0B9F|nr:DUF3352 domain-containing protein [Leptothoe sp. PORK10 BA2]MEA5464376.1 DUF3352 domain-containing protein [Leptothoe sp. PORK10 BA2]
MVLKQRPPLLVTVSTAALLVLGGAAAYLGIGSRLSSGPKPPMGMELVPSDALMALTLTTDESQWTRLRQMGTPESQRGLDRWLVTWRDRIISANGYRFRTDIQPWLGEQVTLAFLPKSATSKGATEMVLVVPIADSSKAQEILSEPQEGITWVGRDYKGVSIQSITTAAGETYESTVLGSKWLVLASGTKGIEAVIDSSEGGVSMLNNDDYQQAFKHLNISSAMAQVYINVPVAASVFTGSDTLPEINGLVAAANLLPNGLDIEASTWLGPEDQPVYRDMVNAPAMAPSRLPADTVIMVSTSSIGPLWQALKDAERINGLLPVSSESLAKGLKTQTGLDIDNDILPWLGGEAAFGLLPPADDDRPESTIPMGQLALVADVADRQAADVTWEQLNEVLVSRFRFDVEPLQINSQPVSKLVSFPGGIAMGHGWLDQDVTFFAMGPDILDQIAPRPDTSLRTNRAFKTLLDTSPQDNSGYFFVDVERLTELQGTLPFPILPDGLFFSALRSLGVTTRVQDERSLSYDIFVELPKGQRVKPLPESKIASPEKDPDADAGSEADPESSLEN